MSEQDTSRVLQQIFTGQRVATPAMGTGVQEGQVVSATATQIVVTIDRFSATATFTCKYEPRFAYNGTANVAQIPPAGTGCLIGFPPNSSTLAPWVVAFTGWPSS